MSKRTFLREFIKENKMVGSLTPSSRFLAAKMIDNIDFSQAKIVVELGPGTGVFTRKIVEKLDANAHLLVFELNDGFCERLTQEFKQKNVHIIHDSADQIEQYLNQLGFDSADVILSSLPLANFSKELRTSILSTAKKVLIPTGKYIQFQYSLQAKNQLKELFNEVKIKFTPLNIPPAFVYVCKP
jgi:phosphatidylethanolamine/phosphatidyl-N-methylethanolamine N-methyltransferase